MPAPSPKPDRQEQSRNLQLFDGPAAAESGPVSRAQVVGQPNFRAALRLSQSVAGLEDKQVCDSLGIDAAQWSRIKTGNAHFPPERLVDFMRLCGNDIPLVWLAHQRGQELKPLRSTLEQQVDDLRAQLADRDRELDVIRRFVRETSR